MATDTRNITKPWQTRIGATGEVLQGVESLDQFIRVLLGTQLGSVPQMLDLGVDWLAVIDLPVDEAMPTLASGIAKAFRRWIEPRAKLLNLTPIVDGAHLRVQVAYLPAGSSDPRTVEAQP